MDRWPTLEFHVRATGVVAVVAVVADPGGWFAPPGDNARHPAFRAAAGDDEVGDVGRLEPDPNPRGTGGWFTPRFDRTGSGDVGLICCPSKATRGSFFVDDETCPPHFPPEGPGLIGRGWRAVPVVVQPAGGGVLMGDDGDGDEDGSVTG